MTDSDKTQILAFWPDFLAGSVAGSSGVIIGHPLDTIKVRQQSSYKYSQNALFTSTETGSYSSQFRVLYRGLLFPMLTEGVRQSIFFGCYGLTLKYLGTINTQDHWYGRMDISESSRKYLDISIAAVVGGTVQSLVGTPVEQIKVIKQAERSYNKKVIGSNEFLRRAVKSPYFWKHSIDTLNITIIRESYGYGAYMVTYIYLMEKIDQLFESYKNQKTGRFTNKSLNDLVNSMFSGGMAGVVSWGINMPVDNIKTRLQVEFCSASPRYNGIIDCFIKICQQEGLKSFWNGLGVVSLRAFPVNAVTLTVYTYSLNWFNYLYYTYSS